MLLALMLVNNERWQTFQNSISQCSGQPSALIFLILNCIARTTLPMTFLCSNVTGVFIPSRCATYHRALAQTTNFGADTCRMQ